MKSLSGTTIAGSFALAAFAVAIVSGLASGNPAMSILSRALIAMVICYPIGLFIGMTAQWLVEQSLDAHRQAHPLPEPEQPGEAAAPAAETASARSGAGEEDVLVV